MKVSIYTTAWGVTKNGFDFKSALDNWFVYASEVSIAVPAWETETTPLIEAFAKKKGYNVSIVRPEFGTDDPMFYGKTLNAALQNCTGDMLVCQDLDERWSGRKDRMEELYRILQQRWDISAFFIPTVDLYGSYDRAAKIGHKWYQHRSGLFRGPAPGTLKPDGRPVYEKTSTDELLSITGQLVPTADLCPDLSIESVRRYAADGWPISFHLGYFDLKNRAERAEWWGKFWRDATGGDPNGHVTDVTELEKRHTFEHKLPLWPKSG